MSPPSWRARVLAVVIECDRSCAGRTAQQIEQATEVVALLRGRTRLTVKRCTVLGDRPMAAQKQRSFESRQIERGRCPLRLQQDTVGAKRLHLRDARYHVVKRHVEA